MTRYLVVAHQTATSALLLQRVAAIAERDPSASFGCCAGDAPGQSARREGARFTWNELDATRIGARARRGGARRFEGKGLRVSRTIIGDASPMPRSRTSCGSIRRVRRADHLDAAAGAVAVDGDGRAGPGRAAALQ